MSKLDDLVRSKGYKNFMAKLYGIGAAVVILGAMFKIMHWPGADPMIVAGMSTEAIIFLFSAFEPLHVEYDWSLVYPELAGMEHDEDSDSDEHHVAAAHAEGMVASGGRRAGGGGMIGGGIVFSSDPMSQQLDKMLEDAKIGPELIESLGKGMQNLADSANSLNGMVTAVAATDKFVYNMDNAAEAVSELSDAYRRNAASINRDSDVSDAYLSSLKDATDSVSVLSNIYRETAQTLSKGDVSYVEELKKMATSLSSINAMYEIQLQNSTTQLEATKQVQDKIQNMVVNFANSADDVLKYKEQVDALSRKVAELNKVYGNMLAAMQTPRI
ncbi:MAG: gliding motility protein GldL [Bacteroidales bacterium]|jgi:methyl-accepting chemotaxis protein|nr:gliding motility protein GldL [Bacteroidales bacterium]